ncbi:hypothetical protein C4375_15975 [Devosia sp. I507]|nr:hypothetical protein C4375_15975 [Devosia sp. I507]
MQNPLWCWDGAIAVVSPADVLWSKMMAHPLREASAGSEVPLPRGVIVLVLALLSWVIVFASWETFSRIFAALAGG